TNRCSSNGKTNSKTDGCPKVFPPCVKLGAIFGNDELRNADFGLRISKTVPLIRNPKSAFRNGGVRIPHSDQARAKEERVTRLRLIIRDGGCDDETSIEVDGDCARVRFRVVAILAHGADESNGGRSAHD